MSNSPLLPRRAAFAKLAGASMLGFAIAARVTAADAGAAGGAGAATSAAAASGAAPAKPKATSPRQAWAHKDGRIAMRKHGAGPKTIDPVTYIAIHEVFSRFGMAHDEAQIEVLRSLFTADAVLEVADGSGTPFQTVKTRDAIIANFANVLSQQTDQRRHCMTNVLIESLSAKQAQALAYGVVTAAADGLILGASVYYAADLKKENDGWWRLSRFFIGMDYYAGKKPNV
jgi:hypothetical protein